jgi:FkbM family methyltransferase
MESTHKNLILSLLPGSLKQAIRHPLQMKHDNQLSELLSDGQISFSQEGEDILLNRIFNFRPHGTYVDIGAHHPRRFSNTFFFYKMGWTGINIDAMPGSMEAFRQQRPSDCNLELGIGLKKDRLQFYIFHEPALNTFDKVVADKNTEAGWEMKEIKEVDVMPLGEILNEYLGERTIDFMSIDVEGFEMNILQSNDWSKYRPDYILLEDLNFSVYDISQNPLFRFMVETGYEFNSKLSNTLLFKKKH